MRSLAASYLKKFSNIPGWHTKRRFVVVESDDWGSIRMPSKEVFLEIQKRGVDLKSDDGHLFNKYDSLAGKDDLDHLFNILSDVKDSRGRFAVFTPVAVVANPDFVKIKEYEFEKYFYETIDKTLKRYPGCEDSFSLWQEGIKYNLFVPQFHGREHLNVNVWMKALKAGHRETHIAFENNFWGITTNIYNDIKTEFQAAFDFYKTVDVEYHKKIVESGLELFETLFGYKATYFAPPNGTVSYKLFNVLVNKRVKTIYLSKLQQEPVGNGKTGRRFNWIGKKTKEGLIVVPRNCLFEPVVPGKDWVDRCLKDISEAFKYHKPAIISSHRVNYVGSLYPENRENGLRELSRLLKQIVKKWPDTEFVTSGELAEIMSGERKA